MSILKGVLLCALAAIPGCVAGGLGIGSGGRTIQDAILEAEAAARATQKRDTDPSLLYPAHNLSVPVDHFHNESQYEPHANGTFDLRYWFDASHYKPGGPVIILQSGETSGVGRLVFLQKGLSDLASHSLCGRISSFASVLCARTAYREPATEIAAETADLS